LTNAGRRAAALSVLCAALGAGLARADSLMPVRLTTAITPIARLDKPLRVTVQVSADAGVLDDRTGPLRMRVKLATECGGTYQYTAGTVLLDKRLSPQPSTGHAYSGSVTGSAKPTAYGMQTVCVWLEDEGDQRVFASDQSSQVDVSQPCTRAAARYDVDRRRRTRGAAALRRKRKILAADGRAARAACGPGVAL
jgi:hypothetical protein